MINLAVNLKSLILRKKQSSNPALKHNAYE